MNMIEDNQRRKETIEELVNVWEKAVLATHDFLTLEKIEEIKVYLPEALKNIPILAIVEEDGKRVGFAGVSKEKLEMLFIAPDYTGKGIGRRLLEHLFQQYGVCEVGVNEQNPKARGFYERMGFSVYKREALDEQGQPFPILYMKR